MGGRMKVKELKAILEQFPEDAIVWTNGYFRACERYFTKEPVIRIVSTDKDDKSVPYQQAAKCIISEST